MRLIPGEMLETLLDPRGLVDALREAFREEVTVPPRHHHPIEYPGGSGTLLLMPAWSARTGFGGVKQVSVYPGNADRGLPSIYGVYTLFDQTTGVPLAVMDGRVLTLHRTAAAPVLAASYLARPGGTRLLMVGTGQLAPYIVRAYTRVLGLSEVSVWGRNPEKARLTAAELRAGGIDARPVERLEEAAERADVISCATLSHEPLSHGRWLRPGVHLDLIGGLTPEMRETDDEAIRRASVFVDTREGALSEAGDLLQPIRAGVITDDHIRTDLYDLARGRHPGRSSPDEITCFKSVGTALEDLAAATMAYQQQRS